MCIPQTGCSRTIQASGVCRRDQLCQCLVVLVRAKCKLLLEVWWLQHTHTLSSAGGVLVFALGTGWGLGIGGKLFARTETHGNTVVNWCLILENNRRTMDG